MKPTPLSQVTVPLDAQVPIVLSAAILQQIVLTLRTMPSTLQPQAAVEAAGSISNQVMQYGISLTKPEIPESRS